MHATFRGAPGTDLAVLTLTRFPAPPDGERYALWLRTDQGWTRLDLQGPDREGKALQVLNVPGLMQAWPKELRITREAGPAALPSGPSVVAWQPTPDRAQPALP